MKHALTASDSRTIPYHARIAISQYGDHFRAELFTEDLGDTDGDLISADWPLATRERPTFAPHPTPSPSFTGRDPAALSEAIRNNQQSIIG
jgi:hypothetical protein